MERDAAVRFLRDECIFDPPLSEQDAENLWRPYREAVQNLPVREARAPERLPLDNPEREAAQRFLQEHHRRGATNILDVIKVDPFRLVVHQHQVVLDRAQDYADSLRTSAGWIAQSLPTRVPAQSQVQIQARPNTMDIRIPHAEFVFAFDPRGGFQIQELARHVTVTAFEERIMLWAGYHRSYARIATTAPDAIDRSLLVVLTTDGTFAVAPDSPNQGLRDTLCGLRPPLFSDFFDERFFMRVQLLKKRFELRVRAKVVPINE